MARQFGNKSEAQVWTQTLQSSKNKVSGFTIVELLIVVIVIAILATITIVSFSNIRQRAVSSAQLS